MNSLSGASVLILCGGLGKRLRPVVSDRQKAVANIMGRPFITFILDQILEAGGKEAILCTGFMGDELEKSLDGNYRTLYLCYSKESRPLGTAGAIRNAFGMIRSDNVVVYNGDSYCGIDPRDLLKWHLSLKSVCTISLVRAEDAGRYGRVGFDPDYSVTSFDEKKAGTGAGWVNAGIYCMNRGLIASMRERENLSLEKDFFPAMIGKGLFAFPQEARFIDIGTPSSYREAEAFFRDVKGLGKSEKTGDCER
jgi:NDP-sugar pyrophosphorylase family protein